MADQLKDGRERCLLEYGTQAHNGSESGKSRTQIKKMARITVSQSDLLKCCLFYKYPQQYPGTHGTGGHYYDPQKLQSEIPVPLDCNCIPGG